MLIQTKVQIDKESYDFIKNVLKKLKYKSLSEYVREAVREKITQDRKRVREQERMAAMKLLGKAPSGNLFESIEGDDFEYR